MKQKTIKLSLAVAILICFSIAAYVLSMSMDMNTESSHYRLFSLSAVLPLLAVIILFWFFVKKDLLLYCLLLLASAAAILLRVAYFDFTTLDFSEHLMFWLHDAIYAPGVSEWASSVGDYSMPYRYILSGIASVPYYTMYSIKFVSMWFDFALAFFAMLITARFLKAQRMQGLVFAVVLFIPTFILNSAFWAQCDAIYVTFAAAGVYFGLVKKSGPCFALMAIAFAFKLQAIFILPILLVFVFAKRIKISRIWVFVLTYVIMAVPSILVGQPPTAALLPYLAQVNSYTEPVLNAPTWYNFVPGLSNEILLTAGIVLAGVAVLVLLGVSFKYRKMLDDKAFMIMASLFTLSIPFLLPHMHERYFYLADYFSIFAVVINRKRWFVPIFVIYASIRSYSVFLFENENVYFIPLTILVLAAIVIQTIDLAKLLRKGNQLGSEPSELSSKTDSMT